MQAWVSRKPYATPWPVGGPAELTMSIAWSIGLKRLTFLFFSFVSTTDLGRIVLFEPRHDRIHLRDEVAGAGGNGVGGPGHAHVGRGYVLHLQRRVPLLRFPGWGAPVLLSHHH